jgi:hypothetical protein
VKIPLEVFTGKRQDVSHLQVFGAKCWARIPTIHSSQVTYPDRYSGSEGMIILRVER